MGFNRAWTARPSGAVPSGMSGRPPVPRAQDIPVVPVAGALHAGRLPPGQDRPVPARARPGSTEASRRGTGGDALFLVEPVHLPAGAMVQSRSTSTTGGAVPPPAQVVRAACRLCQPVDDGSSLTRKMRLCAAADHRNDAGVTYARGFGHHLRRSRRCWAASNTGMAESGRPAAGRVRRAGRQRRSPHLLPGGCGCRCSPLAEDVGLAQLQVAKQRKPFEQPSSRCSDRFQLRAIVPAHRLDQSTTAA